MSEKKEEITGIVDIGIINPKKENLIKFLDKIYSIPFEKSKEWEKEIFDFFRENVFIVYVIKYSEVEQLSNFENDLKEDFFGKRNDRLTIYWDSNTFYKDIIKIRDSTKIDPLMLKKYYPYLFKNAILLRKMQKKRCDEQDSAFEKYHSTMLPYTSTLTNKNGDCGYVEIFFFNSDGEVEFNPKKYTETITDEFLSKLKSKIKKNKKGVCKRNPLDSKLRHECFKRDNYTCKECGATKEDRILHCDHILPVSQGGADELENLQTLCQDCNLAKSNRKWVGGKQ